MTKVESVLVTGGAGYVGSRLVPQLLDAGYKVKVLDLYLYGAQVFDAVRGNPNLTEIKGDIRDRAMLKESLKNTDAVIHLACISNDPSFELNPELGKSINYDAFEGLVDIAKGSGVRRFVYASSSSVYGVKSDPNVTEDCALEPLTDYSKFKAMCEDVLMAKREPGFTTLILRPATVCGYAPRQRLDLVVNILTNHAVVNKRIRIFGGDQMRPNLHIQDMVELYLKTLEWPDASIDGKVYNAGYQNYRVRELAEIVQDVVGQNTEIVTEPTDDNRSYHVSSELIRRELGFEPRHSIQEAVAELSEALRDGRLTNTMNNVLYHNIKLMQSIDLK